MMAHGALAHNRDGVGCHNPRTLLLRWVFRDCQAALWYSLISPLTVVRRLIRAVVGGLAWVVYRRVKGSASVRTVMVVVALELGKDGAQVPFPVDQQMIEALSA